MSIVSDITVKELIQLLSVFPEDKPVKVLAAGVDNYDTETVENVAYPCCNYDDEIDDEGNPVFVEENDWVGIFTKEYNEVMLMNGI